MSEGLGSSVLPRQTLRPRSDDPAALPAPEAAALPRTTVFMSSDSALSLATAPLTCDERCRALACGKRAFPTRTSVLSRPLGSQHAKASVTGRCSATQASLLVEHQRRGRHYSRAFPDTVPAPRARTTHSFAACRVVAVQAHGEAALSVGALHGVSFCCLTFELTRPVRKAALGRQPRMSLRPGCRPRAACLAGSRVERGVRHLPPPLACTC